jgi:hypothetical protein
VRVLSQEEADREGDDLSGDLTAEARVDLVWTLSARMWELSGPTPSLASTHRLSGCHPPAAVTDDWFDVLAALLDAEARFLVVGAHAMAVHGIPRGTQDLDVWVEATADNVDRVWQALVSFGASLEALGVSRADLVRPAMVVQIGMPPQRIDVLTSISGVPDFGAAWAGRSMVSVRGRMVPFAGRDTLIVNKRAAGRPKDLADLHALERRG